MTFDRYSLNSNGLVQETRPFLDILNRLHFAYGFNFVFAVLAPKGRNMSARAEAPRHIIIVETGHALSLRGCNTHKTPSSRHCGLDPQSHYMCGTHKTPPNRHCGLDPQSHMCGTIKFIGDFASSPRSSEKNRKMISEKYIENK